MSVKELDEIKVNKRLTSGKFDTDTVSLTAKALNYILLTFVIRKWIHRA